jgi:hypothetical protein
MMLRKRTLDLCVGVAGRVLRRQAKRGGIEGRESAFRTYGEGGGMDGGTWRRAAGQLPGRFHHSIR